MKKILLDRAGKIRKRLQDFCAKGLYRNARNGNFRITKNFRLRKSLVARMSRCANVSLRKCLVVFYFLSIPDNG